MRLVSAHAEKVAIAVTHIAVQCQLANRHQWVPLMRPRERVVEDVDADVRRIFRVHDLNIQGPSGEVALLDGVEQVFDVVVGFLARETQRHVRWERLNACRRFKVPFYVFEAAVLELRQRSIDDSVIAAGHTHLLPHGIRMYTITIDMPQARGDASLPKEMHQRMDPLLIIHMKVPKHVRVRNIRTGVLLMAPVHRRKLNRIPDKKHGKIIAYEVLVPLLRKKLERPPTDVAHGIARTLLPRHRRYTRQHRRLPADLGEEVRVREVGDVVRDLKLAPGASRLGVDHAFAV